MLVVLLLMLLFFYSFDFTITLHSYHLFCFLYGLSVQQETFHSVVIVVFCIEHVILPLCLITTNFVHLR